MMMSITPYNNMYRSTLTEPLLPVRGEECSRYVYRAMQRIVHQYDMLWTASGQRENNPRMNVLMHVMITTAVRNFQSKSSKKRVLFRKKCLGSSD